MLTFTEESPIIILPFGAESITFPKDSGELLRYLSDQLRVWMQALTASPKLRDLSEGSTKKLRAAISFVEARATGVIPASSSRRASEIREYFMDEENLWNDLTSTTFRVEMERLAHEYSMSDAVQFHEANSSKRRMILAKYRNGVPPNQRKSNTKGSISTTVLRGGGEANELEESYRSAEASIRSIAKNARLQISEYIESVKTQASRDKKELDDQIQASVDELKSLHDLTRTYRDELVKTNEDIQYLKAEFVSVRDAQAQSLADLRGMIASTKSNLENEVSDLKASIDTSSADGALKIKGVSDDIQEAREQASKELDAFKVRYEEKARLHLPTEYWAKKGTRHFGSAIAAFLVFVGVIAGVGYLVLEHFGQIWSHLKDLQSNSAGSIVSVTGLAFVTMPAIAFFWILKHISRVFVENLAQSNDAAQRRVMMQTYLALVGDPTAKVSDQERLLVLNALFRPSATHGSDDAPPASLIDLILKKDGK